MEEPIKKTFTFGRNWRRFLKSYTPERQKIAKDALLKFLGLPDLKGKTFLDIGSGSGIHAAAAFLAGAERIHCFDYDPDSVMATRYMHEKMGAPANWTIEQASVLDDAYMASLGKFDIVYSWGVLHHTGDQWKAIANAASCAGEESRFFIALYAKEAYIDWEYWQDVKRRYNEAGMLGKLWMEVRYVWIHVLNEECSGWLKLPKMIYDYKQSRGMALWSDVRDWLGGWPTEFSSVQEIHTFARDKLGMSIVNLNVGEGNTEFLLMKTAYAQTQGIPVIDGKGLPSCLPVLGPDAIKEMSSPVWIFGAAKGAEMVFDYLSENKVPVLGFIDITPSQKELKGKPVFAYDDFAKQADKQASVVLASRYIVQNYERLAASGFENVVNGHAWITRSVAAKKSRL